MTSAMRGLRSLALAILPLSLVGCSLTAGCVETLHPAYEWCGSRAEVEHPLYLGGERVAGLTRGEAFLRLRDDIRNGSPEDKESALWIVHDKWIVDLLPDVIAAITDTTLSVQHEDTGWGYVYRQAGSTAAWVAARLGAIDADAVDHPAYSVDVGPAEGQSRIGRLEEVQRNWEEWWNAYLGGRLTAASPQ